MNDNEEFNGMDDNGNNADAVVMTEADNEVIPLSRANWKDLTAEVRGISDPVAVPSPTGMSTSSKPLISKTGLSRQLKFKSNVLNILSSVLRAISERSIKDFLSKEIMMLIQRNELLQIVIADKMPEVFDFYEQHTGAEDLQISNPILVDFIRTQKKESETRVCDRATMWTLFQE